MICSQGNISLEFECTSRTTSFSSTLNVALSINSPINIESTRLISLITVMIMKNSKASVV